MFENEKFWTRFELIYYFDLIIFCYKNNFLNKLFGFKLLFKLIIIDLMCGSINSEYSAQVLHVFNKSNIALFCSWAQPS